MIISVNFLITTVAEVVPTVFTHHLVAAPSFGYCHLTRWALLCIAKNFPHTENLIDHLKFFAFLIILQARGTLTFLLNKFVYS